MKLKYVILRFICNISGSSYQRYFNYTDLIRLFKVAIKRYFFYFISHFFNLSMCTPWRDGVYAATPLFDFVILACEQILVIVRPEIHHKRWRPSCLPLYYSLSYTYQWNQCITFWICMKRLLLDVRHVWLYQRGVIRSCQSKDRQHNRHKKKDKRINNDSQNITQKTTDWATRTP